MRATTKFSGLVAAALCLLAFGARAEEYTYQFQRVIEASGRLELKLTNYSGAIEITGQDDNRVIIDAVKRIKAGSKEEGVEIADHIEIRVDEGKGKVAVSANYLPMRDRGSSFWKKLIGHGTVASYGAVDFSVKVPRSCAVAVDNAEGSVTVSDLDGKVTVNGTSRAVNILSVNGDVAVKSAAAEVRVGSVEGSVDIANSSGSFEGEMLFGPVTVRQAAGRIDLQFVEGDVRIKATSANITLRQESGALDIATTTGGIDVQTGLKSSRDLFIATESGDIHLAIPPDGSGLLRVRSETGTIRTEVPVVIDQMTSRQLVGALGQGGARISLNSISGDVTVAQF